MEETGGEKERWGTYHRLQIKRHGRGGGQQPALGVIEASEVEAVGVALGVLCQQCAGRIQLSKIS